MQLPTMNHSIRNHNNDDKLTIVYVQPVFEQFKELYQLEIHQIEGTWYSEWRLTNVLYT